MNFQEHISKREERGFLLEDGVNVIPDAMISRLSVEAERIARTARTAEQFDRLFQRFLDGAVGEERRARVGRPEIEATYAALYRQNTELDRAGAVGPLRGWPRTFREYETMKDRHRIAGDSYRKQSREIARTGKVDISV